MDCVVLDKNSNSECIWQRNNYPILIQVHNFKSKAFLYSLSVGTSVRPCQTALIANSSISELSYCQKKSIFLMILNKKNILLMLYDI